MDVFYIIIYIFLILYYFSSTIFIRAQNILYIGCVQQRKQLSKRFVPIGLYF